MHTMRMNKSILLLALSVVGILLGTIMAFAHIQGPVPTFVSGWHNYDWETHTAPSYWTGVTYTFDAQIYGYQDPSGGENDFQYEDHLLDNTDNSSGDTARMQSVRTRAHGLGADITWMIVGCPKLINGNLDNSTLSTQEVYVDMDEVPWVNSTWAMVVENGNDDASCTGAAYTTLDDTNNIES